MSAHPSAAWRSKGRKGDKTGSRRAQTELPLSAQKRSYLYHLPMPPSARWPILAPGTTRKTRRLAREERPSDP
jgi:hypothetical protein